LGKPVRYRGIKSLIFLTDPNPALAVSFAGQPLSFIRLGTTPISIKWGADITGFAGQTGELQFSAVPGFTGTGIIDSIQFSTLVVPEPTALTLILEGLLGFTFVSIGRGTRKIRGKKSESIVT
jgi:hypothetical protein